ncbi:MAG: hypothetical protein ACK56F_19600 [bacterium]
MYYDSPKLLLPPHFSQWGSLRHRNMILTPRAACEGGASHDIFIPRVTTQS